MNSAGIGGLKLGDDGPAAGEADDPGQRRRASAAGGIANATAAVNAIIRQPAVSPCPMNSVA